MIWKTWVGTEAELPRRRTTGVRNALVDAVGRADLVLSAVIITLGNTASLLEEAQVFELL